MGKDTGKSPPKRRSYSFNIDTVDIRLIRTFMAVVEAGGMSAAQLELNLALSTISEKVTALEKRFGLKLCRRGRAGFALTEAGEQFYYEAERLIAAVDMFGGRVGSLTSAMPKQLTLGLVDNMISDPRCPVSPALRAFADEAKSVHMRLITLTPNELLNDVLARRVDMVVGSFPKVVFGLDYIDLYSEQQNFYCSAGHPLFDVSDEDIGIDTIREHRIISRSYWGTRDTRIFAISAPHASVSDMEAEAHLILSGAYLGYLPEHMAAVLSRRVPLRAIRKDLFSYPAQFQIALRENWKSKPALRLMVQCLQDATKAQTGGLA